MPERARIMWSDSSRAAAHNLDDLRERWMARREEENLFEASLPEHGRLDFTNPSSVEEALAWSDTLLKRYDDIGRWLSNKNIRLGSGRMSSHEYHRSRQSMIAEKDYIIGVRRMLRGYVRDARDSGYFSDVKETHGNIEKGLLAKALGALERVMRGGTKLDKEDFDTMLAIRRHLDKDKD